MFQTLTPYALLMALLATASCGGTNSSGGMSTLAPVVTGPQQAEIDLGRHLMFDERLSRPRGVSCGSCHDPMRGWGDGRPQGRGVQDNSLAGDTYGDARPDHDSSLAVAGNFFKTALAERNTPTLYNAHIFPNLFWDGSAGALAHQALFQMEGATEMNSNWSKHVVPLLEADADYPAMFTAAYGAVPISAVLAAKALGAYGATVSVFDTPYDEFLAGNLTALSAEAQAGLTLFRGKAGCVTCHAEPLLSNLGFVNTGVPDAGTHTLLGTKDFGYGKRTDLTQSPPVVHDDSLDYMKFKVPQLRMASLTSPYMHNGIFSTLEEVIDFYDAGGGPDLSGSATKDPALVPLGLSAQEKSDLLVFLREGLTGNPIN